MLRITWTVFIILIAGVAVAGGISAVQMQALKQGVTDLAKNKAGLISALADMNAKCADLSEAMSKAAAASQRIVDENVAFVRTVPAAAKLVTPGAAVQGTLKNLASQATAVKAATAERGKQIPTIGSDVDSTVSDLGTLLQQLEQDPAQAAILLPKLNADAAKLVDSAKSAQRISDAAAENIADATQQLTQVKQQVAGMKVEYSKLKMDGLGANAQKMTDMMDSMSELDQGIQLQLQAKMDALTRAQQALAKLMKAHSDAANAIIANLKG